MYGEWHNELHINPLPWLEVASQATSNCQPTAETDPLLSHLCSKPAMPQHQCPNRSESVRADNVSTEVHIQLSREVASDFPTTASLVWVGDSSFSCVILFFDRSVHRTFDIHFYFAGVTAGFARGTGVCFSTWLAVAHSASRANSEIGVPFALVMTRRDYAGQSATTTTKDFCSVTGGTHCPTLSASISVYQRLKKRHLTPAISPNEAERENYRQPVSQFASICEIRLKGFCFAFSAFSAVKVFV
jgi:hypothetical protein